MYKQIRISPHSLPLLYIQVISDLSLTNHKNRSDFGLNKLEYIWNNWVVMMSYESVNEFVIWCIPYEAKTYTVYYTITILININFNVHKCKLYESKQYVLNGLTAFDNIYNFILCRLI